MAPIILCTKNGRAGFSLFQISLFPTMVTSALRGGGGGHAGGAPPPPMVYGHSNSFLGLPSQRQLQGGGGGFSYREFFARENFAPVYFAQWPDNPAGNFAPSQNCTVYY